MKKLLSVKTFAVSAILVLLCTVIYATVSYVVTFSVKAKLGPSTKFALTLTIDKTDHVIFDNSTSTPQTVYWAGFNYATLYLDANAIGSTTNPLTTLTNESSLTLTLTNKNSSGNMFFKIINEVNSPFELTPELGVYNIAPNASGSVTIKNNAIANNNYTFQIDGGIQEAEYKSRTINIDNNVTTTNQDCYVGIPYITKLTTAEAGKIVEIESIQIGSYNLAPTTEYLFDSATGRLEVLKSDLEGDLTINTILKNKTITLTIETSGCHGTFNNQALFDNSNQVFENVPSYKNIEITFSASNPLATAWAFDIFYQDQKLINNYNWKNGVLTIPASIVTQNLTIEASLGVAWTGEADETFATGAAGTYSVTTPEQIANVAALVNSGTNTMSGYTFQLENDLFLNDEIFTFHEELGLVKIHDPNLGNTIYFGTSLTPTLSSVTIKRLKRRCNNSWNLLC